MKKSLKSVLTVSLLMLFIFSTSAQTISSRQNGQWSSVDTWLSSSLTGTISTVFIVVIPTSGITGSGTKFLTEVQVGDKIVNASDAVVGTVQSIANNTSLTLAGTPSSTILGGSFKIRRTPKSTDDVTVNNNVTIDGTTSVKSITVKSSKTLTFSAVTTAEMSLTGDLSIESGAILNLVNRKLTIGGNLTNNGTLTAGTGTIHMNGTSHSFSGSSTNTVYNLTSSGSGTISLSSGLTVSNNGILQLPATKILNLNGNTLTINGALDAATIIKGSSTSSIVFGNNSTRSSITFSSDGQALKDLTINSTGDLELKSPLEISGTFQFPSSGKVITSSSNLLSFTSTGTYSNNSQNSFVSGPISKVLASTDPFIFPVGKGGLSRAVGIELEGTGGLQLGVATPTTFQVEYFNDNPMTTISSSVDETGGVNHISGLEYWDIHRSSGTANARIALNWGATSQVSDNAMDLNDLIVAHYYNGKWRKEGNVLLGVGSGYTSGSITTTTYVSSFSPFTLASSTINNPLPVIQQEIELSEEDDAVTVNWQHEGGLKPSNFVIERGVNSQHFSPIGLCDFIEGKTSYSFIDKELKNGNFYYRVRTIFPENHQSVSNIERIRIEGHDGEVTISPNPFSHTIAIAHHKAEESSATGFVLRNLEGGIISSASAGSLREIEDMLNHNAANLRSGAYLLEIYFIDHTHKTKLIKL